MNFLDDLIARLAHRIFNAVLAVGTGLVYVQFVFWCALLAGAGVLTVTWLLMAVRNALLGG